MLDFVKMNYRVSSDQTNLFTRDHIIYDIELSVNDCDPFKFPYQCNKETEVDKRDVLECLYSDATAYEITKDILDFAKEYGFFYDNTNDIRKAYQSCEDAYMWFTTEFSGEQYDEIVKEFVECD